MDKYVHSIEDVTVFTVSSPLVQMQMLQDGRVDAIVGYLNYPSLIAENFFYNTVQAFSSSETFNVHAGILPEYSPLLSIVNKAILSIPPAVLQQIAVDWIQSSKVEHSLELTPAENEWIDEKHTIRARVSYWPPYMFKNPEPTGMSVEYLKIVAEMYGLNVEFVPDTLGWTGAMEDLKTGREYFDVILTMSPTAERSLHYALSDPYLDMPWVIIASNESSFISGINDLNGKTVSVEKNFVMHKKLQNLYPDIKLKVVDSSLEALESVSGNQSDAYIGNLGNSTFLIQEHNLSNLKVAAPSPFGEHYQAIAVRSDWPELASIFSKGLASLSPLKRSEIKNKWLSVRYEHGLHTRDIIFWVVLVMALSSIIIYSVININSKLNREIEGRKNSEAELEKYIQVVDEYVMIITLDLERKITKVSDAFCKISKFKEEELIGYELKFRTDIDEDFFRDICKAASEKKIWRGEIKNRSKTGDDFWVEAMVTPIISGDITTGYTFICQDISNKKRVEKLSVTDKLTGLYNRLKLDEVLPYELMRANRSQLKLSVALIDIDFFKSVNDSYGHQVGDKVLQAFSFILKKHIRNTDILGRWGGEEFLLICPETGPEGIVKLAENIRKNIEGFSFEVAGPKTASFGVTSCTPDDTAQTILNRSDKALYKAKARGRNCVMYL